MTVFIARTALPAAVITIALGISACGGTVTDLVTDSGQERSVVTVAQASAVPDVVSATDRFGLELLFSAPRESNAVVSPASAVIALSMLADGAAGETATQFDAVLGASGSARTDAVNALLAEVEKYGGDPAIVQEKELPDRPMLHVANEVVLDDGFTARPEYLQVLAQGYGAGIRTVDLGSGKGKKTLDAWVDENTGGLIKKSAIEPSADLRMVLQNATVFAAAWERPFDEYFSERRPFTLSTGDDVKTQTMARLGTFKYYESEGWRAVRLPYSEGFHMDVVLPPQGTDPASIPAALKAELSAGIDAANLELVDLSLPSVDIAGGVLDLRPALESAGLGDLFNAVGPDLSGISDQNLFLSQAKQQTVLAIDEAGTVAAAVTELGVGEASAPVVVEQIEFRVDRPYLLSINHTQTSWPLFVAAIRDPRH